MATISSFWWKKKALTPAGQLVGLLHRGTPIEITELETDLPPARIERSVISYMKPIFQAHTVSKILDLNDRITDVSRKAFNRHEFLPFTNTIFIKLG